MCVHDSYMRISKKENRKNFNRISFLCYSHESFESVFLFELCTISRIHSRLYNDQFRIKL